MEDDLVIDENAEGVDEEIVKPSWPARRNSWTRWKHLESLTCAKIAEGFEGHHSERGKLSER